MSKKHDRSGRDALGRDPQHDRSSEMGKQGEGLEERRWRILLERIASQEFLPFIGAEECSKGIPTSSEIAKEWAGEYKYPLKEGDEDLARVAQFVRVVEGDEQIAHQRLASRFKGIPSPTSSEMDDPHAILAKLPLPLYITTNHHNFMSSALKWAKRDVRERWCQWKIAATDRPVADSDPYRPTPANPCVFHLFGSVGAPTSLVLTEDDYLDFLIRTAEVPDLIPQWIRAAVASQALLFIGYHPRDFEFRVLLRCLKAQIMRLNLYRLSVSIDVVGSPLAKPEMEQILRDYLTKYCQSLTITVHWQSPREFMKELHGRWTDRQPSE